MDSSKRDNTLLGAIAALVVGAMNFLDLPDVVGYIAIGFALVLFIIWFFSGRRWRIEMCFESTNDCIRELALDIGKTKRDIRITPYNLDKIHRFRVSPQRRRWYASSSSRRGHQNETSGVIKFIGFSKKTDWYKGSMSAGDDNRGGLWIECIPPIQLNGANNILFELEIQTTGEWDGHLGIKIPSNGGALYVHRKVKVKQSKKTACS